MIDRAIIADDHPVFRDAMSRMVADLLPHAIISEASTMDEVRATAAINPIPGLFLLDLLFPGMNLKETVPNLKNRYPAASIIIISMLDDQDTADIAMASGADGFIGKSHPAAGMRDAILAVLSGKFVVLASSHGAALGMSRPVDLTARQTEVLSLMIENQSNKEIARALDISPFTVRIHVSTLLRVLNVQTRSEAATKAKALGLTPPH